MPSQSSRLSTRRTRPLQPYPASRPTRQRSDVAQRLGRHVLRYATSGFLEHLASRGQGHDQASGRGQIAMDVLIVQLLEEVIQYLVRHNFFRRARADARPPASNARDGDGDRHQARETPQSSYEQRRRHRRQRRTEIMMASLDRLSSELELTQDAVSRVIQSSRNSRVGNEPLLTNADDLRQAISRSTARIESVRNHYRRDSRRSSRHGRAGRGPDSVYSRSSSQLHSQY